MMSIEILVAVLDKVVAIHVGSLGTRWGGISRRAWRLRCGGSGDLGSGSVGHYQGQAVLQGGRCSQVMQY